ncbi:hypothetical protein FCV25MIE_16152, partial [Fagus crenata]
EGSAFDCSREKDHGAPEPFHPCNLTFIHSTIEAKVSLLTLVLISGAPRDFSELTIGGTFRDLPRALFSPYSQQGAGL